VLNRLGVPLSGLRAALARMGASSENVANLQTDGYAKRRTTASEGPRGGVQTRVDKVALSEEGKRAAETLNGAQNDVDLSEELIEEITARSDLTTNSRVVRAADRMIRSVLDLFA
jgi:flagellar hook protein FlgE